MELGTWSAIIVIVTMVLCLCILACTSGKKLPVRDIPEEAKEAANELTILLGFLESKTFFRNSACLQAVEQRWGSLWPNTPRFKFFLHMRQATAGHEIGASLGLTTGMPGKVRPFPAAANFGQENPDRCIPGQAKMTDQGQASFLQAFELQGLQAALEIILDGQSHPVLFDRESEQLLTAQYLDKCQKTRYRFLIARNDDDLDTEERRRLCEELSADPEKPRKVWLLRTVPSAGVAGIWTVEDRRFEEFKDDTTHMLWKDFPMMEITEFPNPDEFSRAQMVFQRLVVGGQGI
ncbi:unnamed protein product, partial [Mesorhabditis spiculigera]